MPEILDMQVRHRLTERASSVLVPVEFIPASAHPGKYYNPSDHDFLPLPPLDPNLRQRFQQELAGTFRPNILSKYSAASLIDFCKHSFRAKKGAFTWRQESLTVEMEIDLNREWKHHRTVWFRLRRTMVGWEILEFDYRGSAQK